MNKAEKRSYDTHFDSDGYVDMSLDAANLSTPSIGTHTLMQFQSDPKQFICHVLIPAEYQSQWYRELPTGQTIKS